MKLILTAAIDNLGVPGDIVEVKAGYGRNYLLPRGYAVPATGAEKQVQDLKRAQEARAIRDADRAREVKEQLANLEGVSSLFAQPTMASCSGLLSLTTLLRPS